MPDCCPEDTVQREDKHTNEAAARRRTKGCSQCVEDGADSEAGNAAEQCIVPSIDVLAPSKISRVQICTHCNEQLLPNL